MGASGQSAQRHERVRYHGDVSARAVLEEVCGHAKRENAIFTPVNSLDPSLVTARVPFVDLTSRSRFCAGDERGLPPDYHGPNGDQF